MKTTRMVSPCREGIDVIRSAGGESCKLCYQCGLCNIVCPWNAVRNFDTRKLVRQAQFGLSELGSEETWLCTTCGRCIQHCPREVGLIDIAVSLRRIASRWGNVPASLRRARASIASEGNPWQEERRKRSDWAEGLNINEFSEDTELLYFVGCVPSYDRRLKNVAAATVDILTSAGVSYGTLGTRESCCGESIRKAGDEGLFKTVAKNNIILFIETGVRRILTTSPHCYHTFRNDYREFGVAFEVSHMSQYLLGLILQGKIEFTKKYAKRVAYHDPCYLGRHNGIYDEPREILKRVPGLELVEMSNSRSDSLCCGGGGGRIWLDTPKGERLSDLRLVEAVQAGAEVLATFCQYCIVNFEDSRLSLPDDKHIEIKDVTEIVREVL